MKIFCLCLVKNESDILEETISAAAIWADGIFIADHNSSDKTPDIIRSLTERFENVYDAGPVHGPFSDAMRGLVFQRIGGVSTDGDWWCRLDSDEFYIDDPREFIRGLAPNIDMIWGSSYQFYFTEKDVQAYEADPVAFKGRPIRARLRYYKNNWSELRLVKQTYPFLWTHDWPVFSCSASPLRIRLAHYQYRSPEQILTRLEIRRDIAIRTKGSIFSHEIRQFSEDRDVTDGQSKEEASVIPRDLYWERVKSAADLDCYEGNTFVGRERELREIRGVWNRTIPFIFWKSFRIAWAVVNPKKFIRSLLYTRI